MPTRIERVFAILCLVSAGILIGLGFIAAVAKFGSQIATKPTLLDIGRLQFAALHTSQWITFPPIAVLAFKMRPLTRWLGLATIGGFAVQLAVVMPKLAPAMSAQIAGEITEPTNMHRWYIAVATVMVLTLLGAGLASLRVFEKRQATPLID